MWVEVYRWYDTRALGKYNLLLERRAVPRFRRFETLAHDRLRFGEQLPIPSSLQPIFWTMHCSLTGMGKLRGLLYRFDEVTMRVQNGTGRVDLFRVFPWLLDVPSMGNTLPSDLAQFAAVLDGNRWTVFQSKRLRLDGRRCPPMCPSARRNCCVRSCKCPNRRAESGLALPDGSRGEK